MMKIFSYLLITSYSFAKKFTLFFSPVFPQNWRRPLLDICFTLGFNTREMNGEKLRKSSLSSSNKISITYLLTNHLHCVCIILTRGIRAVTSCSMQEKLVIEGCHLMHFCPPPSPYTCKVDDGVVRNYNPLAFKIVWSIMCRISYL